MLYDINTNKMTEFVKQMLNREFTYAVGCIEDLLTCLPLTHPNSTFSDNIGLYFELAHSAPFSSEGTRRVPSPWSVDTVGEEEYQEYETHIKFDMIKKIERDTQLGAVIVPLQIKIKEMLYSPHNRRGRAFIEKQIDWAFESD